MSDVFYIVLMVITSGSELKVIYNHVTVDEYRNYKIGAFHTKVYSNSSEGFLKIRQDIDVYSKGDRADETFIDFSNSKNGYFQKMLSSYPVPSAVDVKRFSEEVKKEGRYILSDDESKADSPSTEMLIRYGHHTLIRNVARNK